MPRFVRSILAHIGLVPVAASVPVGVAVLWTFLRLRGVPIDGTGIAR